MDIKELKKLLKENHYKVYVSQRLLLDKNNPNGDQKRYLKLYTGKDLDNLRDITKIASEVLGWQYSNRKDKGDRCIIVHGCGMDMHFHTVYSLSCALYCPKKYDRNSAYKLAFRTTDL